MDASADAGYFAGLYKEYYKDAAFTHYVDKAIDMKQVVNTNKALVHVDKFGDNGIVTVVAGHQQGGALHIRLWRMSCRVLKRGMEDAMMDTLVAEAAARGIKTIVGYYYPTAKNAIER